MNNTMLYFRTHILRNIFEVIKKSRKIKYSIKIILSFSNELPFLENHHAEVSSHICLLIEMKELVASLWLYGSSKMCLRCICSIHKVCWEGDWAGLLYSKASEEVSTFLNSSEAWAYYRENLSF